MISTWFVPVAVDQHIHRRLQDAEGELFAHVLRQAGRGLGGRSQGVYLFSPDGELLGFSNTADASRVRRLLATALEEFNPAGVATTDEPVEDQPAARPLPEPPAGGLVINVASKVLGGYEPDAAERFANSLGRDHLWLRADEVQAIASGTVPDSVARRIARYHLVDNTRGEPSMWSDSEVKHVELNVHAGRLTGTVHLETEAGDRGYQADLLGFVETAGGQITRFDLLAKGQFWGHGRYTRGAPEGKFPLAIAFSLNDGNTPADRVPPQGARRGVNAYLR